MDGRLSDRHPGDGSETRAGRPERTPEECVVPSLDRLEERIKFLLERYAELSEQHRTLTAAQQRLDGDLDPIVLDERLRTLETENDRLVRHAAFLEDRIRELLSRIRYVVEA